MLDTLLAAAVFALVVAVGLAVLYAVAVLPFVLAATMAERRGFSTGRWGGLAAAGVVVALGLAFLARHGGASRLVQVLPLVLAFAAPAALFLMQGTERVGGRAGRHESPL